MSACTRSDSSRPDAPQGARAGWRGFLLPAVAALAAAVAPPVLAQQPAPAPPAAQQTADAAAAALAALKGTYVRLANNANAVLWESPTPSPKSRIAIINTHADHNNNFEYFIGREMAVRGYRALNVNYYGAETEFEEFLAPIAAAVRYARSLPGVEKVVFATHSGGGPMLAFYQEVAEKGPSACQEPSRIYPCSGTNLANLPKVDGVLFLSANIGAPHRLVSLDPAVQNGQPRTRNPALDLYSPANGYDPAKNAAAYPPEFLSRYLAAVHARSDALLADAQAKLSAIKSAKGPYKDDEPFVVDGMAVNSTGARLNLADPNLMSQTHAPHLILKADGTTPVQIAKSVRAVGATAAADRDTLNETTQNTTVKHYLSFLALRTGADYAVTVDNVKGIDWRSSANSLPGNVENVTVPTLVMAGTCAIHLVFNEIVFDRSAARDKEFVAVEGATHNFTPCRPEFGDTRTRWFNHVDAWLSKPGRF